MVSQFLLPPFVLDDKRKKYESCQLCEKGFTMFSREHQCKRCKRAVCENCSTSKAIIIGYDNKDPHRVCGICKQEIHFISRLL